MATKRLRLSDNALLALAATFGVLTAVAILLKDRFFPPSRAHGAAISSTIWRSDEVLRKEEPRPDSFTLVEFGDYQCPPCRAAFPMVEALRSRHRKKLSFVFRHTPLVHIHPLAMRAAVLAETARDRGEFEEFHRLLYSDPKSLQASTLEAYARKKGLGKPGLIAAKRVQDDLKAATRLRLAGTPTFMLCFPDGQAREIRLGDIERLLPPES